MNMIIYKQVKLSTTKIKKMKKRIKTLNSKMLMLDTSCFLKGNFYFTVLQSTDPTQCIMAVMFDLYRHCSENVIVDMSDFHAQN